MKKLAIGAPYPEWSVNMCRDYWDGRGFDVVSITRIAIASDDTLLNAIVGSVGKRGGWCWSPWGGLDPIVQTPPMPPGASDGTVDKSSVGWAMKSAGSNE